MRARMFDDHGKYWMEKAPVPSNFLSTCDIPEVFDIDSRGVVLLEVVSHQSERFSRV